MNSINYNVKELKALIIEPTNVCNLKCTICQVNRGMKREKGYLDLSLFKEIMDDNKELKRISLNVWGEPLLHKDIFKMVAIAKTVSTKTVMFTTNGTLLNKDNILKTIDSGLDIIEISMDGLETTYQKIRSYMFCDLEKSIITILEEIAKHNSKLKVGLVMTVYEETKDDMEKFNDKWSNIVNHIKYQPMVTMEKRRKNNFCPEFFGKHDGRLVILWTGKVILCCQDVEGILEVGDARKDRLQDIWKGKILSNLREMVKSGVLPLLCSTCNEYEYERAPKRYDFIT